jgi:uncharacterized protein YggE
VKLSISAPARCTLALGLLVALPTAGVAQFGTPAPPQGITVTARGVVAVPADSLRFQVMLHTLNGASLDDAGKTVAQTLRQNGVPDALWSIPLDGVLTPTSNPAVTGSIQKPTRDKLEGILRATAAALPASLAASLSPQGSSVSWTLKVDDCDPAYGRAAASALVQAHHIAERLARDAGVTLGRLSAISRTELSSGGCGTKPDDEPTGNQFRRGDAYGNQDVFVSVGLTVTYTIR